MGNGLLKFILLLFVSMVVLLFVFFSLQRYFVRGLLAGSVKG